jgi:hypothetical protein
LRITRVPIAKDVPEFLYAATYVVSVPRDQLEQMRRWSRENFEPGKVKVTSDHGLSEFCFFSKPDAEAFVAYWSERLQLEPSRPQPPAHQ